MESDRLASDFKSKPTSRIREDMREIVIVRIKYDYAFKENISSPSYKNALPYKVAESLEDSMIGGWQHMKPYHLRSHDYKMFKSLCDLCRDEIKTLLA